MTIDEFDRKILHHLQSDASLPAEAIGEKIGLSRNACWRRIKQMEENGVITGRVTTLNPAALGLGLSVIVIIKAGAHEPGWLSRFEQAVKQLPEIIGAHRMSGDLDYVLRVRVADVGDYDRFYKSLIGQVPIADISASFVMEDIKDTPLLPVGR